MKQTYWGKIVGMCVVFGLTFFLFPLSIFTILVFELNGVFITIPILALARLTFVWSNNVLANQELAIVFTKANLLVHSGFIFPFVLDWACHFKLNIG